MDLGKVDSIFRYPVKSMMGEKIEETCVTVSYTHLTLPTKRIV